MRLILRSLAPVIWSRFTSSFKLNVVVDPDHVGSEMKARTSSFNLNVVDPDLVRSENKARWTRIRNNLEIRIRFSTSIDI
jgi:hypothetical protein